MTNEALDNDLAQAGGWTTVEDNASTQGMVPWMIGLSFRTYIIDKLKGDIK